MIASCVTFMLRWSLLMRVGALLASAAKRSVGTNPQETTFGTQLLSSGAGFDVCCTEETLLIMGITGQYLQG